MAAAASTESLLKQLIASTRADASSAARQQAQARQAHTLQLAEARRKHEQEAQVAARAQAVLEQRAESAETSCTRLRELLLQERAARAQAQAELEQTSAQLRATEAEAARREAAAQAALAAARADSAARREANAALRREHDEQCAQLSDLKARIGAAVGLGQPDSSNPGPYTQ